MRDDRTEVLSRKDCLSAGLAARSDCRPPFSVAPDGRWGSGRFLMRSVNSVGVSSRHSPSLRSPMKSPPILTRFNMATCWPIAANIIRTCRFLPS